MESFNTKIQNLIQDGYNFKFGDYISESFRIVNKNVGGFIGFTFIYLLIVIVMGLIPIIGSIGNLLISPPLAVGFYIVAKKIKDGESTEFGNFFDGFKFFGDLVVVALLTLVVMLVIMIPIFVVMGMTMANIDVSANDVEAFGDIMAGSNVLLILLAFIPLLYIGIAYVWSAMLVVFRGMKGWEAMETSRKLITKNWFMMFLYVIVIGLIGSLGVILFGIGLLYTIPVYMVAAFVAFDDIVGSGSDDSDLDDVMDHLVE